MNTAPGEPRTDGPDKDDAPHFSPRTLLRGLAWDVGLPLVGYYGLHLLGFSDWTALLAATGVAAARIVWSAVRRRSLNLFATVMLLVFGLGVLLALVGGDARFLLLKNSFVTGAVGVLFLVSLWWRTPLALAASQSFQPERYAHLRREYDTEPLVRRGYRVSSVGWGVGLLTEAVVRVPLVYVLPISVMVAVGEAMSIAFLAGLIVWNRWYVRRLTARAAAERGSAG